MDSELLTTGEVARLCGVTPDAVLKWIKKGRLAATRTPGGHYRVSRADCAALGIGEPSASVPETGSDDAPNPHEHEIRCWEYFSADGTPRDACKTCLVYQARAQNCYKLAELGERAGHRRAFCLTNSCEDCPFFRAGHGLATSVLVLTRDEGLRHRLTADVDGGRVALRFAGSGYEASTGIGDLCPAAIILDSDLAEVRDGTLLDAVRRDPRVPGVTIWVACRTGHEQAVSGLEVPWISAPFTGREVEEVALRASRTRRAPLDVA